MRNIANKKQGFTIIEVVLVLAIAGLIFLIVFLALPALQRSQRDTQRKNDLSRFMSQVTNYASNNQGALPGTTSGVWNTFIGNYLTNSGQTFNDPTTGSTYTATYAATVPGTAPTLNPGDLTVYGSAKCGGGWGVSQITPAASRSFATIMYVEQGGFYCQSN